VFLVLLLLCHLFGDFSCLIRLSSLISNTHAQSVEFVESKLMETADIGRVWAMSREEDEDFRRMDTLDGQLEHRRRLAIEAQFSKIEGSNVWIWDYIRTLEGVVYKNYRTGFLRSDEGLPRWRSAVLKNKAPYHLE